MIRLCARSVALRSTTPPALPYHSSTMTTTTPLRNWEEELLKQSLSKRVSGGFGAFWVAGQRMPTEPPPVPPQGPLPQSG